MDDCDGVFYVTWFHQYWFRSTCRVGVCAAVWETNVGFAYALIGVDLVTAPATPSNTARAGGIVYPIIQSLAETFGSDPKDGTQSKIGSFLVFAEFHGDLITSTMFMTAMAPNLVAVTLAKSLHITLSWMQWFLAGIVQDLFVYWLCHI